MHKFISVILLMWFAISVQAQKSTDRDMRWMELQEAEAASRQSGRPILIDLYTTWCGWCKVMDKKTYRNPEVVRYLREKFYPVKLNAEAKKPFTWQGKEYRYNAQYRTNDLALYLTGGKLSYPTTVIIPAPGEAPQAIPGYLNPRELEMVVKYFGEGAYKTSNFPEFQRRFKGNW